MRMARNIAGIGALGCLSFLAAACGDAVPPAAQASVSVHLQEYDDKDPVHGMDRCPPSRHWVNVPFDRDRSATQQPQQTDNTMADMRAVNNQNGDAVTCSVKANGSGFAVKGTAKGYSEYLGQKLRQTIVSVRIDQIQSGDSNAKGTLTVQDDASINSYSTDQCVYSVSGGSLGIDTGRVWGSVSCEGLGDPSSPGSACKVDTGFFVFENCAQ